MVEVYVDSPNYEGGMAMKPQTVKKTHEDAIQAVADFAIKSIRYWHVLKTEKQRTARFRVAVRCRFPWTIMLFCF